MRHIGNVQVSGSLKQQGSDDNQFMGDLNIANAIILSKSGSTVFGDDAGDMHSFTGSVIIGDDLELDGFFEVYGNAAVNGIFDVNGTFNDFSSQTSKNTIEDIALNYDVSEIIDSLRPVSYIDNRGGYIELGFIAEEVNSVLPILAANKDGQVYGIKPLMFISVLVKEVQNLRQRVAQLENGSI
jgi:hypothetical protein